MKIFPNKEGGYIGVLAMVSIVGILALVMNFTGNRAQTEISRQQHNSLEVDKIEVKAAISAFGKCPKNIPASCSPGESLTLKSRDGNDLVVRDGSKRIGQWNVKVECHRKEGKNYWVYIARIANGRTLEDPLTKKPLDWAPLFPIEESCETESKSNTLLLSNVCYGGVEGKFPLPEELRSRCPSCLFSNLYCGDEQVPFPNCPVGYKVEFRYLDRYGWGGIDLTKYTLCRKADS